MSFIFSIFSSNGISLYVTATIVFLSLLYHIIRSRGLPPGPVGLPYIGYWPFFGDSTIHLQMRELARQYGEVYSFTISGRLTVVLCSFNAIREAVLKKSQIFEMRCQDFSLLKYFFDGSFAFAYGEEWKVLRKFYIQNFKELGMTQFKEDRNGPIYEAVREVLKELENTGGKPLDFTEVIAKGCNKILRTTLFAGDEDITDEILSELCHSYGYTIENMTGPNLLLFGPIAKYMIQFSFNEQLDK